VQVVTIYVDNAAVCVFDSLGKPIESQLSPDWGPGMEVTTASKNHRLHFRVKIPPLGIGTYLVTADTDNCNTAFLSSLSVFNEADGFTCPEPYLCSYHTDGREKVSIATSQQTLIFSTATGLLINHRSANGKELHIDEEIAMYSSSGSGAYLFHPTGDAAPIVKTGGIVLITQGPLVEEVHTIPKFSTQRAPLVRSARLYAGTTVQAAAAEFEYFVDFGHHEFNDREIVTRFKSELNNKRLFYTDLNGFQTIRRETYSKIPVQGNYYPMPSLAFLQCPGGRRLSVHSRQALGVASLNKGEIEIMLDRRLVHDDGRGLGQGITDNRASRVVFHLLVERNVSVSTVSSESATKAPSLLSHRVGAQLNYPIHTFFDTPQPFTSIKTTLKSGAVAASFAPLQGDLPCDFHIVALKVLRPSSQIASQNMGLEHGILFQRRGTDSTYSSSMELFCDTSKRVNVFSLFAKLEVTKALRSSLSFVHDDGDEVTGSSIKVHRKVGLGEKLLSPSEGVVNLVPMEIQAYKFNIKPVG
jgi:alpha-mannosidase II